ncbi:hypothetical protein [Prosthecodimorpha staleyi]|uniref:Uncharacterized protein n=1 Tax=Prosthecodimorpha staleyi TaxID=2840188 RepID=A0A947D1Q3_9HYPH|nr:hypothetical protein [Prosthecodimorpha staleyi]MBT9289348.1 hypothetical protein [Prosthecodimorpha staleyi]
MIRSVALATLSIALFAGAAGAAEIVTNGAADATGSHPIRPIEAFVEVVGQDRFAGYFVTDEHGCAVTLVRAAASDEALAHPIARMALIVQPSGRIDIPSSGGQALRIACASGAGEMRIGTLDRNLPPRRTLID